MESFCVVLNLHLFCIRSRHFLSLLPAKNICRASYNHTIFRGRFQLRQNSWWKNSCTIYMETIWIRYISNYLSNEVAEIEERMKIEPLIQRQKTERMMNMHKEMRGVDRYKEQPKEYNYHAPYG